MAVASLCPAWGRAQIDKLVPLPLVAGATGWARGSTQWGVGRRGGPFLACTEEAWGGNAVCVPERRGGGRMEGGGGGNARTHPRTHARAV
jgi:hypothetical protein